MRVHPAAWSPLYPARQSMRYCSSIFSQVLFLTNVMIAQMTTSFEYIQENALALRSLQLVDLTLQFKDTRDLPSPMNLLFEGRHRRLERACASALPLSRCTHLRPDLPQHAPCVATGCVLLAACEDVHHEEFIQSPLQHARRHTFARDAAHAIRHMQPLSRLAQCIIVPLTRGPLPVGSVFFAAPDLAGLATTGDPHFARE